ncbi:MAG: Gfo/Idh/MocA family oxidoreductase [Caldilineaceae bacterium]|nr:Gfo/Idh/MocA family oxidoreductase [Caldilineaceae bacterium]
MQIAFIGVGGIAQNYIGSLEKLNRPVAAVCDINAQTAARVADELHCTGYTDHREMLDRENLDVVFVAIPPAAHDMQTIDAVQAGAHVFVAKPVAMDLDLARRTQEAVAASGRINQVGYMARYSDITERAKELVHGRDLGMGIGCFLTRMGPSHPWWGKFAVSAGQIVEQSTHAFDWLRYFLGDVESVHAFGHDGPDNVIADFEDSTAVNLRFASGAVGNVVSTCSARVRDGFMTELCGRDLYLRLAMDTHLSGYIDHEEIDYHGQERGYYRQIECFLAAVEAQDQNLVRSSYADAVNSLAVTLAANRSLVSGQVETVD